MAKSQKSSSSSKPVRKTKRTQKLVPKKTPSPKVFKVISKIRSNVGLEFFEGLTQLFPVGQNFSYAFPHESDSSVRGAAGTSEVPVKKISRKKKKSAASEANTAATTDVADVEKKEVPSEGIVGNTQESEAVIKKGMSRPRPKRLRKNHVISPAVGDNLLEIKEAASEEDEDEEMLQARSRRVLPKTKFDGAQAQDDLPADSEAVGEDEDKEEEHKEENPSDQTGGPDVAAGTGDEKEKDENDRLNEELTSEKARLTELATAGMQLKADVARVTTEKQTVEEENRMLRAELEKETAKGKRSRERLVTMHNDLSDISVKNERLHNALNETSGKLIKEMNDDEDRWMSKVKFLEGELEKIRAIMIYAILEDTSTSSSDKQDEDPTPIVVENLMSTIVTYEPPLMFQDEGRQSVGEFEMSFSESVDSLIHE
ncbi:hypothetical protein Dimus_005345 [Dionaea muscipula]